jgi:hypothetical protein
MVTLVFRRAGDSVPPAVTRGVHRATVITRRPQILRGNRRGTPLADFRHAMESFNGSTLTIGVASLVAVGGLIVLGVRYLEARSRRDDEEARLQQSFTEPLAREPALAGSSVLPIVSLPLRGIARVGLTGWVPSREVRDAAVLAVEREARRLGLSIRVVDHIEVVAAERRRPA